MEKHFDYFRFYNLFLVIYCDEKDEIIGHFTIKNGNEFGQLYVSPSHRGFETVHLLIREAQAVVKSLGFPYLWGVFYEKMKKFYTLCKRRYNLHLEFVETPEERSDGQWKVVLYFDETPTNRRTDVR